MFTINKVPVSFDEYLDQDEYVGEVESHHWEYNQYCSVSNPMPNNTVPRIG